MKNVIGVLIGIVLNLQIALGNMNILTILILPIHEQRISFHFFASSIYFNNVLQFSVYRSFTSLVKFIPRYFILFVAFVNCIIFLISLSASPLLEMQQIFVYWFCTLKLYCICLLFLIVFFLVESLRFSTYKIMSTASSNSFHVIRIVTVLLRPYPIWCLIYISCLIALARTSQAFI